MLLQGSNSSSRDFCWQLPASHQDENADVNVMATERSIVDSLALLRDGGHPCALLCCGAIANGKCRGPHGLLGLLGLLTTRRGCQHRAAVYIVDLPRHQARSSQSVTRMQLWISELGMARREGPGTRSWQSCVAAKRLTGNYAACCQRAITASACSCGCSGRTAM